MMPGSIRLTALAGLLFRVMVCAPAHASWVEHSLDQNVCFLAIALQDAANGCAVGVGGALYRTTDSGRTWAPQESAVGYAWLRSICLLPNGRGWIAATDGTILRTTDGGARWVKAELPGLSHRAVAGKPDGAVLAAGYPGQLMRSTDGGIVWQAWITSSTAQPLAMLNAVWQGERRMVAVGVRATALWADGDSIQRSAVPVGATQTVLQAVAFDPRRPSRGVAVGDQGTIWVSQDGGQSFHALPPLTARALSAVTFDTEGTAWLCGEAGTVIELAADGTARIMETPRRLWLHGAAATAQGVWFVGAGGTILEWLPETTAAPATTRINWETTGMDQMAAPKLIQAATAALTGGTTAARPAPEGAP